MLKRILTIAAIVFAVSGLALANVVDIDQVGVSIGPSGSINYANVIQTDAGADALTIDVDQTAGTYNEATTTQYGNGMSATVVQNAGTSNVVVTAQGKDAAGNGGMAWSQCIIVNQTATTGYNYANMNQVKGTGNTYQNDFRVTQLAVSNNDAIFSVGPGRSAKNKGAVNQTAGTYNYANVYMAQSDGPHGSLMDAASDGSILAFPNPATQISTTSYNELYVDIHGGPGTGGNYIGLHQEADDYNYADIDQYNSNNSLGVYQTNNSIGGYNSLTATQNGDSSATVIQSTVTGNGTISVIQN